MNQLTRLFKKYASGVLLLFILLSPLQSSAALLAGDVAVLQAQAELLTQAIDSSTSITEAKKIELRELVTQIKSIIAVLALQVESDPNAVSQRRLNIEDIIVTGDAKDFDSQVQVVWGPETIGETVYERSTSTYNYDFVTTLAENNKTERLAELSNLTFSQLAAEIGFSANMLKATAITSFKRFDNARDAMNNYSASTTGEGLEMYFGTYSVINGVVATAEKDTFKITAKTDQDETITLSISEGADGSDYILNISYSIYDIVQGTVTNKHADRAPIKEQFLLRLSKIGIKSGVPDKVLVDDLLDFMLNHTVMNRTDSATDTRSAACSSTIIQTIMNEIVYYYIKSFQITDDIETKMSTSTDLISSDPSNPLPPCVGVNNSFFLTLP